ncbi:hypothetical protein EV2_000980 [Malus domestica]
MNSVLNHISVYLQDCHHPFTAVQIEISIYLRNCHRTVCNTFPSVPSSLSYPLSLPTLSVNIHQIPPSLPFLTL